MKRLIFFIPLFIALLMIINCAVGGFDISIVEDDARTAKSYIKAGQDINKRDFARAGMTPLMKATNSLSFEIAKLLIDEGADVNLKDHSGRTALMHVCHIYHYSTKKGTEMDRAEMMEVLVNENTQFSPDQALLFMPTSYLSIDAMAPRNGYLVREKVPLGNKISFDQRGPLPGYVLEIKPGAYDLKADISGSMPLPFENQPLEFRFDGGHIYLALSIVNEQVNRATWRVFEVQIPRKLPLDIT